jgi:hypothetical protein
MRLTLQLAWLGIRGAVVGATLSVAAPTVAAGAACTCDDHLNGSYQCAVGSQSCTSGTEHCHLDCS